MLTHLFFGLFVCILFHTHVLKNTIYNIIGTDETYWNMSKEICDEFNNYILDSRTKQGQEIDSFIKKMEVNIKDLNLEDIGSFLQSFVTNFIEHYKLADLFSQSKFGKKQMFLLVRALT